MSIQSQLNNHSFNQLPLVCAAMQAASGNIHGSMEAITLRELDRCSPCLDDMTATEKVTLELSILCIFKNREWI